MTADLSETAGFSAFDAEMMRNALMMARRGLGMTAPNPSVGAVLTDPATGEIIARAATAPGGRPHAEVAALAAAGARARGATLYVTLEPCAHHGVTPPCAEAVASAGVARVVIAAEDPDPRVQGKGRAHLQKAGICVETGLLRDEARWVARGHILRVTDKRPFVQLKLALDAQGNLPRGEAGQPRWVTGELARRAGHLLRAEADAILIGAATLRDDDPDLTCRLPGMQARSPVRVVLCGTGILPANARLFANAASVPVWLMQPHASRTVFEGEARTPAGVSVLSARTSADGLEIGDVLDQLAQRGITRLLVEGGASVWRAFAEAGAVDEVVAFIGSDAARQPEPDRVAADIARWIGSSPGAFQGARTWGPDRAYVFRRQDMA